MMRCTCVFVAKPRKGYYKISFPSHTEGSMGKTMTAANNYSGFTSAAIYPFNREKVQPIVLNIPEEDENESISTVVTYYICKSHITIMNNKCT